MSQDLEKGISQQPLDPNNVNSHHMELTPTREELTMLRRLRTLQGADYEALYFDNKPQPKEGGIKAIGNPSSLGISVFAIANTMISLYLLQARGIHNFNLLVGVLWFVGGVASWLTAIFELLLGNTFAWCVFGTFGGYYFAFAATMTPAFQIAAGYTSPEEYANALGIYFCCWGICFIVFLIASIKTNGIFVWIFTTVDLTVWCLAASYFASADGNAVVALRCQKAAGALLLACSCGGWYLLCKMMLEATAIPFKLPVLSLVPEDKEAKTKE